MTWDFFSGAICALSWIAGLFFFRFWRTSRDRFFGFFGSAFWLLAVERVALAAFSTDEESDAVFYLLRLTAFLLIIGAIVDKNRAR